MRLIDHPQVQQQLLTKGTAYVPSLSPLESTAKTGDSAQQTIIAIESPLSRDLEKYIGESGFSQCTEWMEALFSTSDRKALGSRIIYLQFLKRDGSLSSKSPHSAVGRGGREGRSTAGRDSFFAYLQEAETCLSRNAIDKAAALYRDAFLGTKNPGTRWRILDRVCSLGFDALQKDNYVLASAILKACSDLPKPPAEGVCRHLCAYADVGRRIALGMTHWIDEDAARASTDFQHAFKIAKREDVSVQRLFAHPRQFSSSIKVRLDAYIRLFMETIDYELEVRALSGCQDVKSFRKAAGRLSRLEPPQDEHLLFPIENFWGYLHRYVKVLNRICRGGLVGGDNKGSSPWTISGGWSELDEIRHAWRRRGFKGRMLVLDALQDSWTELLALMWRGVDSEARRRSSQRLNEKYWFRPESAEDQAVMFRDVEKHTELWMDLVPALELNQWFERFRKQALLPVGAKVAASEQEAPSTAQIGTTAPRPNPPTARRIRTTLLCDPTVSRITFSGSFSVRIDLSRVPNGPPVLLHLSRMPFLVLSILALKKRFDGVNHIDEDGRLRAKDLRSLYTKLSFRVEKMEESGEAVKAAFSSQLRNALREESLVNLISPAKIDLAMIELSPDKIFFDPSFVAQYCHPDSEKVAASLILAFWEKFGSRYRTIPEEFAGSLPPRGQVNGNSQNPLR